MIFTSGAPTFSVCSKIKAIKSALQWWNKEHLEIISNKIARLQE